MFIKIEVFILDIFAKEYDAIRDRIFDLLKEQKISQRDFAQAIKVSPQTITDWKKGKSRSFSTMISVIAPALHTTPSWLYWGNGSKYFSDEDRRKLENQRAVHLRELKVELDKYNEEFKQDIIDIFKKKMYSDTFWTSAFEYESIDILAESLGNTVEQILNGTIPNAEQVTSEERQLLLAYRNADARAREMVKLALEPFGLSAVSEEAM